MEKQHFDPNDTSVEKAVDLMDNTEVFSDSEIEAMMSDKDIVSDVADLLDIKRATLLRTPKAGIDIDREWERFEQKTRRPALLVRFAGIAAAAAVVVAIFLLAKPFGTEMPQGTIIEAKTDNPLHPMLSIGAADEQELSDRNAADALAALGVNATPEEMTLFGAAPADIDSLTLTIPRGQTYKVVLSDSSEVWMNNDCRLTYPNRFKGSRRCVKVEGEAYFKVAPDKQRPFIVLANGIEVKVYGTEFNVRAYGADDVHVTLIKGSVAVKSAQCEAMLKPGQDAKLNSDASFGIADIDTESYIYWRDGFFYYDDIPLEHIMQDIGRWYNMNVVMKNDAARNYHLHFLADKKGGIDNVIRLLNSMGKVKVSRNGNTLIVR